MDFSRMMSDLLSKKSVVIININDGKDKEDKLALLIERLIKAVTNGSKATPMG